MQRILALVKKRENYHFKLDRHLACAGAHPINAPARDCASQNKVYREFWIYKRVEKRSWYVSSSREKGSFYMNVKWLWLMRNEYYRQPFLMVFWLHRETKCHWAHRVKGPICIWFLSTHSRTKRVWKKNFSCLITQLIIENNGEWIISLTGY